MKSNNIKTMTFTGMFAALIFLTTFVLKIPTGFNGGYIHVGDALIYLAAVMLPKPFAMAAAAIGAGFSDLATPGAMAWIPATVIIKPLCCLPFTSETGELLCKRNVLGTVFSAVVTIVGYGIAAAIMTGSVAVAVAEAPAQLVQSTASAICFIVVAAALQKANLKNIIAFRK